MLKYYYAIIVWLTLSLGAQAANENCSNFLDLVMSYKKTLENNPEIVFRNNPSFFLLPKPQHAALTQAIEESTSITIVDLTWCHYAQENLTQLLNAIHKNTTITFLKMADCFIDTPGIKSLAQLLEKNSVIKKLDLSYNKLGLNSDDDSKVKILCNALKSNTSLTKIFLRKNNIEHHGSHIIADLLKNNTTIINLNLDENPLCDEGIHDLAQALKSNVSLKKLSLQECGILDQGFSSVMDMLNHNKSLKILNLWGKPPSPSIASSIVKVIERNTTLTNLYMSLYSQADEIPNSIPLSCLDNFSLTTFSIIIKDDNNYFALIQAIQQRNQNWSQLHKEAVELALCMNNIDLPIELSDLILKAYYNNELLKPEFLKLTCAQSTPCNNLADE